MLTEDQKSKIRKNRRTALDAVLNLYPTEGEQMPRAEVFNLSVDMLMAMNFTLMEDHLLAIMSYGIEARPPNF